MFILLNYLLYVNAERNGMVFISFEKLLCDTLARQQTHTHTRTYNTHIHHLKFHCLHLSVHILGLVLIRAARAQRHSIREKRKTTERTREIQTHEYMSSTEYYFFFDSFPLPSAHYVTIRTNACTALFGSVSMRKTTQRNETSGYDDCVCVWELAP